MSKRVLSKTEAAALIKPGDRVHTFRSSGAGILIGADWDRDDLLKAIESNATELAGKMAMGMGHGLCIHVGGPLFVETVENPESVLDQIESGEAKA